MFCPQCRYEVAATDRFCARCGAALTLTTTPTVPPPVVTRSRSRGWVIAFAILLCLTCFGLVIGIPLLVTETKARPAGTPPRNLGWLIAGGVYLLLFFMIIAASGGHHTVAPSSPSTPSSSLTTSSSQTYKVGDTITLKNHTLTVTEVKAPYHSPNSYVHPTGSDHQFVVVHVVIHNTGRDTLPVNPLGFRLEDETGTQRTESWIMGLADGLEYVQLSPGGHVEGNIGFEAKVDSRTLKLHYSGGLFGGGEVVVNLLAR